MKKTFGLHGFLKIKVQRYKRQSDNVSDCEHSRTKCLDQGPCTNIGSASRVPRARSRSLGSSIKMRSLIHST